MRVVEIVFPWPERALWPNAKCGWEKKHRLFKRAKFDAWIIVKSRAIRGAVAPITWAVEFHPPKRTRKFDLDNALAACKAYVDGLAAALEIDDSEFSYARLTRADSVDRGQVVFREVAHAQAQSSSIGPGPQTKAHTQ